MNPNIIETNITSELESSYIEYAIASVSDRAIPDIRDGLKPSQRRILISFKDLKLTSKAKYRKSALVIANASGNYHPHGDLVIYPTMVRMAQPFSLRYPLVDGQGNFGNIGGSPAAAMRYTEARMSVATEDVLDDLYIDGKWTVLTTKNYDETRDEPTVLPSKFPNLLANGSEGIAVGWSTSIAPNNIKEITKGLVALIQNPKFSDEELFNIVKGPDFPNGGIIHGTAGIRQLYSTGNGHLVITGRVKIETKKGGVSIITVYELPYGVTTDLFLERSDDAFKKGRLNGVSHLKDASSERMGNPVQVIFYLKRGEDPQVVLNQLYEHTPLKETYAGNMIALVEGKDGTRIPSKNTLSLRNLMEAWISFRKEIVTKRTEIQLQTIKRELLRIKALIIATDPLKIEKVIKIIKEGDSEKEIINKLMIELNLVESQVRDILEITLRRLMKLERATLKTQFDNKIITAKEYQRILNDKNLISEIIVKELEEIEKSYGDERRTSIEGEMKKIETVDLVPDEQMVIMLTHTGYIKRLPVESYRKTARGAKGIDSASTDEDDFVTQIFSASTHDWLLTFTNKGNVHWLKVYDIPETSRSAKGRALVNLISLKEGEKVTSIIPISGKFDNREIIFGTSRGLIKKTQLLEYGNPRNGGIAAIKLHAEDELIGATLTDGKGQILLVTEYGQCLRVNEDEFGSQGRNTAGKRGIKLKLSNDKVCALLSLKEKDPRYLVTFTKNGLGKRTSISDYPTYHAGGSGIITALITLEEKNSRIAAAALANIDDEVIIISNIGKTIRIPLDAVRESDRRTKGVRLINLESDQEVTSAAVLSKLI